ncbi:MAG: S-ribosylhomocysteine lyase [Firmicutes bacterium]|nr:S-ribosylhomocysteine lyase [Bacillota bacterium]
MDNVIVESFTFDHTKVKAPFVRHCGRILTPRGDVISKFDLRFTQPNQEIMPTGAVHAIEHLLAGFLREEFANVIDVSPMGCRTGFYLILVGEYCENQIAEGLKNSLNKILAAAEVPAANEIQCGNYRDMSLPEAKEIVKRVLDALNQ